MILFLEWFDLEFMFLSFWVTFGWSFSLECPNNFHKNTIVLLEVVEDMASISAVTKKNPQLVYVKTVIPATF